MKAQAVTLFRELPAPQVEMCGQTTLFPVDLPVLFGEQAASFPLLCRAEISTEEDASASVYFAPVLTESEAALPQRDPILVACALLVRYLARRREIVFDEVPRQVNCCFQDTCAFPIVHVSLVGEDAQGYDFVGVIHREPDATEEFAARFSLHELERFNA